MSFTFTKLFSSITESTVWSEPDSTRIVWITMLAMSDKRGRVWGSVPGLAARSRVSVENTKIALQTFLSPDTWSRTKDYDGRRIEEIDGGWRLLNHNKYREIRDVEEQKARKARNQRDYRERIRGEKTSCDPLSPPRDRPGHLVTEKAVTMSPKTVTPVTHPVTRPEKQPRKGQNVTENVTESDRNAEAIQTAADASGKDLLFHEEVSSQPTSSNGSHSTTPAVESLVEDGWAYYIEKVGRAPDQYAFSKERRTQGLAGFQALLKLAKGRCNGDVARAKEKLPALFRLAVDRMCESEFHAGANPNGKRYQEWHHLFAGKGFPSPRKLVEFWLVDENFGAGNAPRRKLKAVND